ncbi:ECF-type riboflavin transporter substrate-binding protein [Paenibacillus macquariensis]|uniref:Energy-coupling factor transport system substrate-specific component n=1 Tax=Paenibacillus macquariensis TaxID=948756 RepID=A0ABY1K9L6_9BACL|nr:ECF-type riboflavin transporter substrate-binding protein [Paenibacillus macquariensis]MEC0092468.1 ECF-type riboflavin transporter substrate-binding protein [Paenibacillus macquariensis]OAB35427.1 hypothetical protein PMSM_09225 [Paenibacillus macquariensis subsp. macquariensis]SIR46987.1 energy-coupling factor transport system substrate-specific component [Paenibacillus macquariensis]
MKKSLFQLNTKTVVTIGICAALYGATGSIGVPIGPDTSLRPAIALLAIFGALFGPIVGFTAGFIGHILTDLLTSGMVWWGWALGSALTGAFMGIIYLYKGFDPSAGLVKSKHIGFFAVYGIVGIIFSLLFSWWFDITFMGEPSDKLVIQVSLASISNIAVFAVLGIPAVLGYAKRNRKASNLSVNE